MTWTSVASAKRSRARASRLRRRVAVEAAQRLVEHHQPRPLAPEGARRAHALPLAARDQRPRLAERRLQAFAAGAARARAARRRRTPRPGRLASPSGPRAVAHVVAPASGSRAAPRDRPRPCAGAGPRAPPASSGSPSTRTLPARRAVPAEQEAAQARLARAGGADDGDVAARRDREAHLAQDLVPAGVHGDVRELDRDAAGARRERALGSRRVGVGTATRPRARPAAPRRRSARLRSVGQHARAQARAARPATRSVMTHKTSSSAAVGSACRDSSATTSHAAEAVARGGRAPA